MKKKTNIEKYLEILKCPNDGSDLVLKTNKVSDEEIIDGSLISKKMKIFIKSKIILLDLLAQKIIQNHLSINLKNLKNCYLIKKLKIWRIILKICLTKYLILKILREK